MATIDCKDGALNTGQPSCVPNDAVDVGIIFVNQLADDGTANKILSTDTIDASYVLALINNTDKSKRWYPVMDLKSIAGVRAENVTEDIDGVAKNITQGVRNYDAKMYGNFANPKFQGVLKSFANIKLAYYKIDVNGNLTANIGADGNYYPIKVENGTLQSVYNYASKATSQNIQLKFMVKETEQDANLITLDGNTITTDLTDISGLIDVFGVTSLPTTTSVVLTANLIYGNPSALPKFEGAVLADFVVYNKTTSSGITPTSVVENTPGVYTFAFSAQTANDVITINLSKGGFEMKEVTATL